MQERKTKFKSKIREKGYTVEMLAYKLKVTPETVFQWADNRRKPNTSTLKQIAKILGCKIEDLVD